jgi:sugar/nucleoside kinase (ribokinase family)
MTNAKRGVTGKCLVLITPDAERSLNTHLGISETLSVDEVNEVAIKASQWVYLEGYLVTSPTGARSRLENQSAGGTTSNSNRGQLFRPGHGEILSR